MWSSCRAKRKKPQKYRPICDQRSRFSYISRRENRIRVFSPGPCENASSCIDRIKYHNTPTARHLVFSSVLSSDFSSSSVQFSVRFRSEFVRRRSVLRTCRLHALATAAHVHAHVLPRARAPDADSWMRATILSATAFFVCMCMRHLLDTQYLQEMRCTYVVQ